MVLVRQLDSPILASAHQAPASRVRAYGLFISPDDGAPSAANGAHRRDFRAVSVAEIRLNPSRRLVNMTRNWTPGTWWRAPEQERFQAYYLCMRECYGMPALEAYQYAKANFPGDLIGNLCTALNKKC